MIIILVVIVVISYFLFFYKPSAYQIAASLNLYTGDPLEDQTLNNLINQALIGGGTIATGNLEWELNDAAARLASGNLIQETLIDGKAIPASALITTIDTTHDFYNGSPDVEDSAAQITPQQLALYEDYIITYGETPENAALKTNDYYNINHTSAQYEESKILLSGATKPGDVYIPQTSLNKLWSILNSNKIILSNPNIIKA